MKRIIQAVVIGAFVGRVLQAYGQRIRRAIMFATPPAPIHSSELGYKMWNSEHPIGSPDWYEEQQRELERIMARRAQR